MDCISHPAKDVQRVFLFILFLRWLPQCYGLTDQKARSHVDQAALVHNHQWECCYHGTASRKRVGQHQIALANAQMDNNKVTRVLRIFLERQVSAPFVFGMTFLGTLSSRGNVMKRKNKPAIVNQTLGNGL